MNKENQRTAIAEACGIVSKDKWGSLYKTPRGILRDCPDYLADLNAMHEAEKVLTDGQYDTFERELARVVGFQCHDEWPAPSGLRLCISATAAQRAEAFLRTINKWEEL